PRSDPPTGVYPGAAIREERREPAVAAPPPESRARKRWPWILLGALALLGLILLLVSVLSPNRVTVPNVVGASISTATNRLQNEGFEVETVRDNSDKPRNTVIGQNPPGGAAADEGSLVRITVSEGPPLVTVPDVVGKGRLEARRTLTNAGFEVRETRTASATVAINRVISQSPDGDSVNQAGRVVTIEVSSGPDSVSVPNVVGKTTEQARSALDAFRVTVEEREDDEAEPGTVIAQDPARGQLARGGTVRLTVAVEPKQISVPDVVGRSQNSATQTLSRRGFEVVVEDVDVDSPDEDNRVQEQSPTPEGGRVDRGSTITITVGRFEPALDPEPDPRPTTPTPPTTTTTPAP
ncbi:MAG TPA: PASTA domain-containing protein, partial [Solirubrobacteraceae bacterium]|nr:PASTA domain-containing protein [Solirubrobacteraceae bacterium]